MSTELVEGRVYLRDTRNGNIHPYEDLLSQMQYMQAFIAGSEQEEASEKPTHNISLTGLERAAEWDRLAGMSEEDRKRELQGKPAPWETKDHLNASDVVARPADAPEPRKPATAATQAAVNAPPAPPKPPAPPQVAADTDAQQNPEQPEAPRKSYRLTDRAGKHTYAELVEAGWSAQGLIDAGYLEEVPVEAAG